MSSELSETNIVAPSQCGLLSDAGENQSLQTSLRRPHFCSRQSQKSEAEGEIHPVLSPKGTDLQRESEDGSNATIPEKLKEIRAFGGPEILSSATQLSASIDAEECSTPRGEEHRISPSKYLVCPPPPLKKKPVSCKRRSKRSDANGDRQNFLLNPPDLHLFPENIRALFHS
ncbi:hypothetical protein KP509_11G054400 [Ceratopteris richardii]|uniref:Uncharacterized protein n=1 Tax=Ceratopteris richardii TaxID=49495 RepID=A0A8T2TYA1_CERRI|nr:hypothetical protein KP509_11G054400 [Ceratopteris richardii]